MFWQHPVVMLDAFVWKSPSFCISFSSTPQCSPFTSPNPPYIHYDSVLSDTLPHPHICIDFESNLMDLESLQALSEVIELPTVALSSRKNGVLRSCGHVFYVSCRAQ